MKTITIKTADLSGAAMDWAVAFAIGKDPVLWDVCCGNMVGQPAECCLNPFVSVEVDMAKWSPSTDWSQGGPLIERHLVQLEPSGAYWVAKTDCCLGVPHYAEAQGGSPLIAACRAIVASKLGYTVEVPADLVEVKP